ncbi:ROK family protein [Streptomyces sp. NPDC006430]|uniref:ROK family protein n=1 Tax=Streptomyces sp. NPDC006430 TaxID=3154299 RepID=UPI0033A17B01
MSTGLRLGFDVGGTNVRAGLVRADGTLAAPLYDVPREGDLIRQLADAAEEFHAAARRAGRSIAGAGIALPGSLDPDTGVVSSAPGAVELLGLDPRDIVLGPVTVTHVVNDADAALLAEWCHGAARGARHAVGVFAGTGIGGGAVVDGRPLLGATGLAGEVGHLPLVPDGPDCPCGGTGCLEQAASGTAVARWYVVRAGRKLPGGAAEVAAVARGGDRLAQQAFAEAGAWLGVGVAALVNLLNPQVVVVGGGMAAAWDLFGAVLEDTARRRAMPLPARAVRIVPGTLGRAAGVIGAARPPSPH